MAGTRIPGMMMGLDPSGKIVNGSDMSTLRGSRNYVWDTNKLLGQGATSLVYTGREKRTGEEVAVKVFTPHSYHRPQQVQMREFEVMRRLNHENIVRLLAIEEEQTMNGGHVIVMELCPNGSLHNVLDNPENSCGLCEEEFLLVLEQVAAGVKHLRDHDIIHRDIKPGNILRCVADDGRSIYKLTDFGAARELQENEEFVSLYGTEEYLHPDMYEKAVLRHGRGQHFGVHVDLWSLGVTFYHAATGSLPFRPYGGRRNKETMHMITTQKEPGVISGVQMTENGPIDYRKELPSTCRLSLGLKRLVTPFLAALLEKDSTRTWPFEQFFEQVAAICSKVVLDVFCPSSLHPLKIYAGGTDTLPRLKELIAEQTDIPPVEQVLLVGGQPLNTLVTAGQPVGDYQVDVTATNPVVVYSTTGVFPHRPFTPSTGQFPQVTPAMNLDHDYPQCKRCCGVLHSIISAVKATTNVTALVNLAVHMYCCHLKQQVEVAQESLSRLHNQMMVVRHWQRSILTQLRHHLDLLQLTGVAAATNASGSGGGDGGAGRVTNWVRVVQAAHQTHHNSCEELFNQLQSSSAQASSQLREAVTMQTTVSDWDTQLGCTSSDRCSEKVRVLLDRMRKILSMFKENKAKRLLSYNEEQIHKFEKNKLSELCTQARSMLHDNCLRKRNNLYMAYKCWFEKAAQCQALVSTVEASVKQITEGHTQLVSKLKNAESRCNKLLEDCVDHLKKDVSTSQAYAASQVLPAVVNGNNSNSATVRQVLEVKEEPAWGQGAENPTLSSSRQERLHYLLDGLHTSRRSLEELEQLVNENTQLIQNFGSLADQGKNGDIL